jgi:hypothetical protein
MTGPGSAGNNEDNALRLKETGFRPGVYDEGSYTVRAIQAGTGKVKEFTGQEPEKENPETIRLSF